MILMGLEKVPFTRYHEEKKVDSFSVRLNEEERAILEEMKPFILQKKDSTALKTLAWFGAKVLHEEKFRYYFETVLSNKSKNKRMGVIDFD